MRPGIGWIVTGVLVMGALARPTDVEALGESSARAMGMGGSFTAVARGVDAVGWNPANLGLTASRRVSLALVSGGVGVGNDAFALEDYNRWNGATWTDADKNEMLSRIPSEGMTVNTAAEFRALGISYGRLAFQAMVFGDGRARFPKDPVDLALFGNQTDRTYTIDDAEAKGQGIWSVSLSGGYPFQVRGSRSFAGGITLRYLGGLGFFEAQNITGRLTTAGAGLQLEGSADARRAEGGSGFSFDLGATGEIDDRWSVGMAILHIGRMSWSKDAREHSGSIRTDSLKVEDLVEVDEFDELFNPVDAERRVSSFSSTPPTTMRLGAARTTRRSVVAIDWEQGLNNSPGASTRPRISAGGEYRVTGWLPVRGGISFGGRVRRAYTIGFGLDTRWISFDLAIRVNKGIFPNRASGLGAATEIKLGF